MDNMATALKMAAGILIAILMVSLILFMYEKLKVYPEIRAKQKQEIELKEFNSQFEVYQKSQMYGTDVISCLNLAYDYNYINGHIKGATGILSKGQEGFENQAIEVEVDIKKPLMLKTEVYFFNVTLQREILAAVTQKSMVNSNKSLKEIAKENNRTLPEASLKDTDIFDSTIDLDSPSQVQNFIATPEIETKLKELKLKPTDPKNDFSKIKALVGTTKMEFKNKNFQYDIQNPTHSTNNNWTRIIMKFPGDDLKTRVFKCKDIEYDKATLRIKKIRFEEK